MAEHQQSTKSELSERHEAVARDLEARASMATDCGADIVICPENALELVRLLRGQIVDESR